MTDRTEHLTVILEKKMRVDDAEFLMNAILAIRGVLSVEIGVAAPGYAEEVRYKANTREKLLDFMRENL